MASIDADLRVPLIDFMGRFHSYISTQQWSVACARLSAGATVDLTRAVVNGAVCNGAAIVRPPGHHAEAHCAKGFCLFNNVAVAAAVAKQEMGVRRILIVDWDVHQQQHAAYV